MYVHTLVGVMYVCWGYSSSGLHCTAVVLESKGERPFSRVLGTCHLQVLPRVVCDVVPSVTHQKNVMCQLDCPRFGPGPFRTWTRLNRTCRLGGSGQCLVGPALSEGVQGQLLHGPALRVGPSSDPDRTSKKIKYWAFKPCNNFGLIKAVYWKATG
jgi:hypothetical protein